MTDTTAVMRRPHLLDRMQAQPGMMILLAAELAGVILLAIAILTIIFLLCLGGYALVHRSP